MDQPILTKSTYPFMIDIDDGVCYCYINSLMKSENPSNLLRMAWYACTIVYDRLLNTDNEINLLGNYKKNELRMKTLLNRMMIQSKERYATLHLLNENFKSTESMIRDCLNEEIRDVRATHITLIDEWWKKNTYRSEGNKMKSTDLHAKFYQEHKTEGIDVEMFKQTLRSIPSLTEDEIIRGKTDKAQYIILGYKCKE